MPWETIILAIIDNLLEIILASIFIVVTSYLRKKGHLDFVVKNKELLTELANEAVLYAQQKYSYLEGEKRYTKALTWLVKELSRYDIKVDPNILEGYIESSVKIFKKKFGDKWYEVGNP